MESTWHAAGAQEMRADFESGGDSGEGGMMPNHPATCVGFPSSPRQAKHQCASWTGPSGPSSGNRRTGRGSVGDKLEPKTLMD